MTQLTPEQQRCIEFPLGSSAQKKHLIIEAGAGAGKTFVLSERVVRLLDPKLRNSLSPSRLFLVTFSRAAQSELMERVRKAVATRLSPSLAELVHISTIDSLFTKLVESKYPAWWENVSTDFKQKFRISLTQAPSTQIVAEELIWERLEIRLKETLERCASNSEIEGNVLDFLIAGGFKSTAGRSNTRKELLRALTSETFLSTLSNKICFASQTIHPASLLLLNEMLALAQFEFYRRIFMGEFTHADRTVFLHAMFCSQHSPDLNAAFKTKESLPIAPAELIIDEYQDTNELQHQLLYSMVNTSQGRMVVVGDPKQSIYGFRNAHVGVFRSLTSDSHWEHIELKNNFRSEAALLSELNTLSELAFTFQNPELPKEFFDSKFFKASLKYSIGANPLLAGRDRAIEDYPRVTLLSASLNAERFERDYAKEEVPPLYEFQKWNLAQHLLELRHKHNVSWKDVVILCESNSKVKDVAATLSQFGVPSLALCSGNQHDTLLDSLQNRVALNLFHILIGPISTLALYEIVTSPLVMLSHEDCVSFFRSLRKGEISDTLHHFVEDIDISFTEGGRDPRGVFPSFAKVFELFARARESALIHPFGAWQILRMNLAELNSNVLQAHEFLSAMDSFASALSERIDSPVTRKHIQSVLQNRILIKSLGSPVPKKITDWRLEELPEQFSKGSSESVKVMTVHSAKGLEWPYVVFWPNNHQQFTPDFAIVLSPERVMLKWLHQDIEGMSVVKRVTNPEFLEEDAVTVDSREGKKTLWFADLQKSLERDFERQRVFYTAFTRARKQLILCSPPARWNSKKSMRDSLSDVKDGDSTLEKLKIKRLEDYVFAQYSDQNFHLRKTAKDLPKSPPWVGPEITAQKKNTSNHVEFIERGPAALEEYLRDAQKISMDDNEDFSRSPHVNSYETPTSNLNWRRHPQVKTTDVPETHDILSSRGESQPLAASTLGIRFHAAQEHALSETSGFSKVLRPSAVFLKHEFEVWIPQKRSLSGNLSLPVPERRIFDMISIHKLTEFPSSIDGAIVTYGGDSEKPTILFRDWKNKFQDSAHLVVITDFKTGRPKKEHFTQMETYLGIVKQLATPKWLASMFGEKVFTLFDFPASPAILGVVCYESDHVKNKEKALKIEGKNLFFIEGAAVELVSL